MAKFLRYGLARGLSVRNDFNADMERATQQFQIARDARLEYEQKSKYYAERLKKPVPFSEVARKRLEPFLENTFMKIGSLPLSDPSWETSIEGQRKFNELSDQIINNPIVLEDQVARKQYESFLADANAGLLTDSQVRAEIDRWDEYNNQDPSDNIPAYTYRRPPEFDLIGDINKAVDSLIKAPDKEWFTAMDLGVYGERIFYHDDRLYEVAKGHYTANSEGYETAWNNTDPKMREVFYQNDIIKFVSDLIKSRLPKESHEVKGYSSRLFGGTGKTGGAGGTTYNRPYMTNVFNKEGSTNDPNIWVMIPRFESDGNYFLNTHAIKGIKLSGNFDDSNAEYQLIEGLDTPILLNKKATSWKRDNAGRGWVQTELMLPSSDYRRYFGSLAGDVVNLDAREVELTIGGDFTWTNKEGETISMPAAFLGGGNKIWQTYQQFGTQDPKFTMFTAWVPMSEDNASQLYYDQVWTTEYTGSNTMYGLYPDLFGQQQQQQQQPGEIISYDDIMLQEDENGNTWAFPVDSNKNPVGQPYLYKKKQ